MSMQIQDGLKVIRSLGRISSWKMMGKESQREAIMGYLCISPWIIGFLAFTVGPIIASLVISFMQWDVISSPRWIGLTNYIRIFTEDKDFVQALKVTLYYSAVTLPVGLGLGLALSLLLNMKVKAVDLYRTLFYIPAVLPAVAVTMLWVWIFNPEFGLINFLLEQIGIQGPRWFFSPKWALPGLMLMSLWGVGGQAVIYLAGLQNIPPHLYEAAEVDGAGGWDRFWSITLPLLTPTLFFQLVMGLIGSFQTFVASYVATGGGPMKSTLFYMLYIYTTAFSSLRMGYGSALAWILTVIILVLTLLVFRTSRYWVYYEAEQKGGFKE